jgi:acetylornithine deacetylase
MDLKVIDEWIKGNTDYMLEKLSELIQIKTINTPPTGNEKPGQEYIYNFISKYLYEKEIDMYEIDDVKGAKEHPMFYEEIDGIKRIYKNRPNLMAKISGSGDGKALLFSGHMDVVPVMEDKWETFEDPYSGKIKDGRMYGRGSNDMKAGTLAGFFSLKCLRDLNIKLKGDVYAESVVDEEMAGVNGTVAARIRYPNIDFAILPEHSDLTVGIETCSGSVWKATFNEKGPGGYAQTTNPIHKISEFVLLLQEYNEYRNQGVIYPENFNGEKHQKLLELLIYAGGKDYIENTSYVPKIGNLYFLLQSRPNLFEKDLWKQFIDFMQDKIKKSKYIKDDLPQLERILRYFLGHSTDLKHDGISALKKTYASLKLKYEESSLNYLCDAQAFKEVSNTEVVVLGPAGENFHGIDEYVDVESILNLIKIMVTQAINYCN